MEYSIVVLLLVSITTVDSQGHYYSDLNRTLSARSSSRDNLIYQNDLAERHRHKIYNEQQFEKIFDHYRSDSRREPRFISFQTKDDDIHVEIDFAIPFLSIPVRRSLSGAMGTIQNVIKVTSEYSLISRICYSLNFVLARPLGGSHGKR